MFRDYRVRCPHCSMERIERHDFDSALNRWGGVCPQCKRRGLEIQSVETIGDNND